MTDDKKYDNRQTECQTGKQTITRQQKISEKKVRQTDIQTDRVTDRQQMGDKQTSQTVNSQSNRLTNRLSGKQTMTSQKNLD